MGERHFVRALPGHLATLILVVAATALASSGVASLFYEGWGQPVIRQLGYLAPPVAVIALGLVALRWPLQGGAILVVASVGYGAWWLASRVALGIAPVAVLMLNAAVLAGPFALAGLLLLAESRHRRLLLQDGIKPPSAWIVRNLPIVLFVGVPLVAVTLLAYLQLPSLLARHDDGLRSARVIEGNGVTLEWAGTGPGWNWKEPGGVHPSWDALMRHGVGQRDRCAYLDADGATLLVEPSGTWRLPAADEIVRSLSRGGTNAGCAWDGKDPHASCRTPPDKETPLWAPDQAPIYYWSAGEVDATTAVAVNYTGGISRLPKSMTGIGYRCVRTVAVR